MLDRQRPAAGVPPARRPAAGAPAHPGRPDHRRPAADDSRPGLHDMLTGESGRDASQPGTVTGRPEATARGRLTPDPARGPAPASSPPGGRPRTSGWHGPPNLRARDGVRGHLRLRGPAQAVPGRGRPVPVPQGGVLGPLQQRLPAQRRPALPRRRLAPGVRHPGVRRRPPAGGPRPGRRADPRGPAGRRRAAAARGGHRRRGLPVQEQHRLGRQLLRLPRELPGLPARRVRPAVRRADPVPGHPAARRRRGQGAADPARCGVLPVPAGRPHLGGRLQRHHPLPARSSTPGTSRTRTPSATAGCT